MKKEYKNKAIKGGYEQAVFFPGEEKVVKAVSLEDAQKKLKPKKDEPKESSE